MSLQISNPGGSSSFRTPQAALQGNCLIFVKVLTKGHMYLEKGTWQFNWLETKGLISLRDCPWLIFPCGALQNQNYKNVMLAVVVQSLSCVSLFVTPWAVACQAPLSMGFPKQENWSRLPFSSPGDLPKPGIEPTTPALAGGFLTTEPPGCWRGSVYIRWGGVELGRQQRGKRTNVGVPDCYTRSSLNHFSGSLRKTVLRETKAQAFSELLEIVVRWD